MRLPAIWIIGLFVYFLALQCNEGAALPLEKRQNRPRPKPKPQLYARPPSVGAPPKSPPLPKKLTLRKSPSFSDWLPGSKKVASATGPMYHGKPWTWKDKNWDTWHGEIAKNVKSLG